MVKFYCSLIFICLLNGTTTSDTVSPRTIYSCLSSSAHALDAVKCTDLSDGWRAVPANEAMYAMRSSNAGTSPDKKEEVADHLLPRTSLHSIYKFGFCTSQATKRQYLRTTVNMSFADREETMANYIYVISDMNTQNFALQCVVMKFYTPRKFLFYKSRIPLYYCQGQLFMLMMNTVHRLAMHEFFILKKLNMVADIYFEFYHPPYL